jgi:hypothetical protein
MLYPKQCPVCGNSKISEHSAVNRIFADEGAPRHYRCEQGHVFSWKHPRIDEAKRKN